MAKNGKNWHPLKQPILLHSQIIVTLLLHENIKNAENLYQRTF